MMINKFGEIVFNPDGTVKDIYGYVGDRTSFEYVELSHYYEKVKYLQEQINKLEQTLDSMKKVLKSL